MGAGETWARAALGAGAGRGKRSSGAMTGPVSEDTKSKTVSGGAAKRRNHHERIGPLGTAPSRADKICKA